MSKLIVGVFLFLNSIAWGNDQIGAFIKALDGEQKLILDRFFQFIIKDSLSGYVLYGDKPICIEGYPLSHESGALSGVSLEMAVTVKGMELWQEMQVSPCQKDYFFLFFDVKAWGCRHMISINRKAFLNAVNDNLALFRYVLGPALTAEGLLNALIESKERFYEVLKNDNVLLGILLGYGTENALLVSREELISHAFASDRKEDFPLISRKKRMDAVRYPKSQKQYPSFSFTSLKEEEEALRKSTVASLELKQFDSLQIPYFGCMPDSEESQMLLDTYEKNRLKIMEAVGDTGFLEKTLLKLFTTQSGTVEIPSVPAKHPLCLPENKKELIRTLVQMIHEEIGTEEYCHESFAKVFLEGVTAREKGALPPEESANINPKEWDLAWELYRTKQALDASVNLEKSDAWFRLISSRKDLTVLVPHKICYATTRQGQGKSVPRTAKNVSFHFSCRLPEEMRLEDLESFQETMGTVKEESLEFLIPGVAMALIGMKQGEEREVYIHPEYAYGNDSFLPPNVSLIATIHLASFEEGSEEAIFSSPCQLEPKNTQELLCKYEKMRGDEFYANGIEFWDFMKKKSGFIDFKTFQKSFVKNQKSSKNKPPSRKFLTDLDWVIIRSLFL